MKKKSIDKKKIKILYIHHGKGIGGASISLLSIIRYLDQNRFEPILLGYAKGAYLKLFEKENININYIKFAKTFSHTTGLWYPFYKIFSLIMVIFNYPVAIIEYYWWISRLNPDIVHLNSSSLTAAAIAAKLKGVKVVWHIREYIVDGYLGLRLNFHKLIGRKCVDRIIAISSYDGERLDSMDKTEVVYNFIDFKIFNRDMKKKRISNSQAPLNVCMLGGISKIKGTIEFIRTYPLVKMRLPNVKFYIAGNDSLQENKGDLKNSIKTWFKKKFGYVSRTYSLVENLGRESIIFTGTINNMPKFLSMIDLLVFPSTAPHFSRPVIEAWAMGIPVIASGFGEIKEIIEDGKDGFILSLKRERNIESFACDIIELLSNKNLMESLGGAGYEKARSLFNIEKNMKQILDIYNKLCI